MLKITGKSPYKGFLLEETLTAESNILVLTGKNGSGKTRFLESASELFSIIEFEGAEILRGNILFLEPATLIPSFNEGYKDLDYVNKVKQTADFFDKNKKIFMDPYDPGMGNLNTRSIVLGGYVGLTYNQLYPLVKSISNRLKKPVEDLTGEDVTLNYEEFLDNPFKSNNLSLICNSYLRRLHENKYNTWRATELGEDVPYAPVHLLEEYFGQKPWVVINEIIDDIFDYKFEFSSPDEYSRIFDYSAKLTIKESGFQVGVESLSSGEKILLWLALTLVNMQYGKSFSTEAPKLLLLDEPDAFLHPKMVTKLYGVLEKFSEIFKGVVIFTTHSPTTVALAPSGSVCMVTEKSLALIDKDLAISTLLDGVNQISIDPESRRNVFVESLYDLNLYNVLYEYFKNVSGELAPEVSLTFVSSGEKLPVDRIETAVRSQIHDNEELVRNIVAAINGVGSCTHVYSAVEDFGDANKKYIRGIVDWDGGNDARPGIVVLAEDYAYTTENLGLDPLSILLLLQIDHADKHSTESFCGEAVAFHDWMLRPDLLQISLDRFIEKVFKRENKKDADLNYTSGLQFATDWEYLNYGEGLEGMVVSAYPVLGGYRKNGPAKDLKYTVVKKAMLTLSQGKFIPVQFLEVFKKLQAVSNKPQ